MNKLIIDIKLNGGAWVLESVLMRELYGALPPNANTEQRIEHDQKRKVYKNKLDGLEYIELLAEFNNKLGHKYELTNLTDEQVKQLEGK
jgi:hypothetical protein